MQRPNIVLILADDMGYGDFGIFNDGPARTPVLDQLAGEGICLTQHYSASCACAPARASLMTGRYPHRTGAIDTLTMRGLDRLALREITLADHLKAAGYVTGLVGKWHLGSLDPRYHPNARGFDEFVGFCGPQQDYYRWRLERNGTFETADGRYLTDVLTEEAVRFIGGHRHEPFFLYLAYNAPHVPLQAPPEDVQPYLDAGLIPAVALTYAMNQRMDAGIGRVREALDRYHLAENTIVLFTSDNGPMMSEDPLDLTGELGSTVRFNCGFNGSKGRVHEGGIRVPMIVRWPAGLEAGQHIDGLVHFTDWLPTLLAAAGVDPLTSPPLDGHNVLPQLRGEQPGEPPRRFWQWNRYTPLVEYNAAVRDGNWKLVRPRVEAAQQEDPADYQMGLAMMYEPERVTDIRRGPEPARELPPPPPPQLFNLADDPLERHDLAAAEPARGARLLRELETWFEEVEAERRSIAE